MTFYAIYFNSEKHSVNKCRLWSQDDTYFPAMMYIKFIIFRHIGIEHKELGHTNNHRVEIVELLTRNIDLFIRLYHYVLPNT